MRIAIIAPLEMRVPPVAYGGTELIVSLLTEELVSRGHEVTLFASGDSITSARLQSCCPQFLRGSDRNKDILNMLNVASCLEQADQFDIIHSHTDKDGMSMAGLVQTPMLTTLHGNIQGDWRLLFSRYKGWYNTISYSSKSILPEKERFAGVIYNAISVKSYPFNGSVDDSYMLFLSRISEEKGAHLAIELAKKTGRRLILAGNIDKPDEEYFKSLVMSQVDGDLIRYVGEADFKMKVELMMGAYCLLAPITWPEPFGLFMVEAMACGTPIVAFNRGSVPEVIKHGETGFITNTMDEMANALEKVPTIKREHCREHVQRHFDVPRMGNDYLSCYRYVLQNQSAGFPVD